MFKEMLNVAYKRLSKKKEAIEVEELKDTIQLYAFHMNALFEPDELKACVQKIEEEGKLMVTTDGKVILYWKIL